MIALYKALIPGAVMSWIFASLIGVNGYRGGQLYIRHLEFQNVDINWSWPLFIACTGLVWAILYMMEK